MSESHRVHPENWFGTLDESKDEQYTFDEEGNYAQHCSHGHMVWSCGQYYCDQCGQAMSRSEYMNYIGADVPDQRCYTCDENYPSCRGFCPHLDENVADPEWKW